MGTRALIRIDDKPVFYTHYDGYPESLGKDLKNCDKSMLEIAKVANDHLIDFASECMFDVMKDINIKDTFGVIEIDGYDIPDWEYNIKDGRVYYREYD